MVWAILAILGVPLWIIVGVLASGFLARRHFLKTPGVFALCTRDPADESPKWGRQQHGRRVQSVLLVNWGLAKVRTNAIGYQQVSSPPKSVDGSLKGMDDPMSMVLIRDDGAKIELAFASAELSLAKGPF